MASGGGVPEVSVPSEADLKRLPEDERLRQAAASAQGMADGLKSKAALLTDPKERERLLTEAYDREIEAKGLSKKARILKTGTFQGAAGGAGIGAASGLGLGTAVGVLLGTVVSVPTTALGGLVGAGTGAIHGPWIKLGGGNKKEDGEEGAEEEKAVQVPQGAIDSGAVQINDKTGQATIQDPEALKETAAAAAEQAAMVSAEQKKATGDTGKRRKPPKLEVRSKKVAGETGERRKPPKLEVRSKAAE